MRSTAPAAARGRGGLRHGAHRRGATVIVHGREHGAARVTQPHRLHERLPATPRQAVRDDRRALRRRLGDASEALEPADRCHGREARLQPLEHSRLGQGPAREQDLPGCRDRDKEAPQRLDRPLHEGLEPERAAPLA